MEDRRITIKDVALAVGVTPQTVSRVFRGTGYVSSDTRLRVLDAADRLKYVPNSAAIRLRTGSSKSIAVVFDSLINIYFSIMVDYLQKELQSVGYNIQTIFVNSHTVTESVYREALSQGASAVISFLEPEESLAAVVEDFGVPMLILGRRAVREQIDYMTTDDVLGGELAAKRFIDGGCKSFAYLAFAFGMTCVTDRYKGFRTELNKHGYTPTVLNVDIGVRAVVEKAIKEGGMPDGVFCFSDMLAYELMNVLRCYGIDNVKIIGYDDIQADIAMPIELTTIGVDKQKYVKTVVTSLLDKVEGRTEGRIARTIAVSLHCGETA